MTYLKRLPRFEFAGPTSLAEVCEISAHAGSDAMLLAGGTDAILQMRRRERTPRLVIGLKRAGMDFIREESGGVAIGATATLQALLASSLVRERCRLLADTASQIGGRELRNVATIGGNVAGALPCADMPPALMTLDAEVKLSSSGAERWIALEHFFPEFGQTAARAGEVLSAIRLPPAPASSAGVYLKYHDRASMDMTVVGVSAFIARDGERVREIRLAYANGAPTVFRARRAEALLSGAKLTAESLEALAEAACQEASPRTSWRANADYRRKLIRALTQRAVREAWKKAGKKMDAERQS